MRGHQGGLDRRCVFDRNRVTGTSRCRRSSVVRAWPRTTRKVEKVYDTGRVEVRALRGVDLALGRGEMVAIMGPSGCGKTTLLNCLSGLDDIDSGEILIDGKALHAM